MANFTSEVFLVSFNAALIQTKEKRSYAISTRVIAAITRRLDHSSPRRSVTASIGLLPLPTQNTLSEYALVVRSTVGKPICRLPR
jgi:hypothetical protein